MKRIDVAIAIIRKAERILICQRKSDDSFGGYWEFPGGKVECDESLHQCLMREVREELNIQVVPAEQLGVIEHDYDSVQVRLHPFLCDYVSGEPELIEVQAVKWIAPSELVEFQFPEANSELIKEIINRLGKASV